MINYINGNVNRLFTGEMHMKDRFNKYKWQTLFSFALMYSFVYLGRFNVNNLMNFVAEDMQINEIQQEMISMSVFLSYAVGSFINGYLADKYGAKRLMVIGVFVSCLLNMLIVVQASWVTVLITWIANGYFQSMIWVGGISMLANWWKEGERGKGVGIANFFSGISHTMAFIVPAIVVSVFPFGWQGSFIIPILVLMAFTAAFIFFAKESPESVGEESYLVEDERHIVREAELREIRDEKRLPLKYYFSQPSFVWWCCIAMISSICRYGLLNWIPLYYENYESSELISETFSNITLPLGMAFGTLVITWLAGTRHFNNKGIIVTAMAAICGTLVIVFPMIDDKQAILVGIFFTGFVLYGINGILWVHAIDQGCRVYAGTVAGIFNGFAYLGAFIEGFLFPAVLRLFNSYISIFVTMEALCLIMVMFGMFVSKKNTIFEPEVRE